MRNSAYFSEITKQFSRPSFEELQVIRDNDGNLIREASDIEFILSEKFVSSKFSLDQIRQYINSNKAISSGIDTSKLSDNEILSLVPPRSVNTLTDAYQYSKYLSSQKDYIKDKINEFRSKYSKKDK